MSEMRLREPSDCLNGNFDLSRLGSAEKGPRRCGDRSEGIHPITSLIRARYETLEVSGYGARMSQGKPYPSDVSDEEWAFAAPYLTLMSDQAPQRKYDLRLMFNALHSMARAGAP
jgi:hypothetical protein